MLKIILDNDIISLYNKTVRNKNIRKGLDKMLNHVMLMGRLTADPEIKTTGRRKEIQRKPTSFTARLGMEWLMLLFSGTERAI